uniref:Uncharacterized protein n=1 Tax=Opuntia streptacantha TaxID=393608 RepID=A0A7C9EH33_OPUST
MSPLSLVLSKNPSGRIESRSGSDGGWNLLASSALRVARTTHKNLTPLLSNPIAISLVCSLVNTPLLPKPKYTTLRLGCESSQLKHSFFSPPMLLSPRSAINGPMQ